MSDDAYIKQLEDDYLYYEDRKLELEWRLNGEEFGLNPDFTLDEFSPNYDEQWASDYNQLKDELREVNYQLERIQADLSSAQPQSMEPEFQNSIPSDSVTGAERYDSYRILIEEVGTFDDDDYAVNLIGIRGWLDGKPVDNVADEYNDTIAVLWREGAAKYCLEYVGSVDPGSKYTKKALNKDGCAHLKDGQYLYKIGKHRKHTALVQAGDVTVWRDRDKDFKFDGDEVVESGRFGINIHAGGTGGKIKGYSAGCQIIKGGWKGSQWKEFIYYVKSHPKKKMYYTLIDRSAIDPEAYTSAEKDVFVRDKTGNAVIIDDWGQSQYDKEDNDRLLAANAVNTLVLISEAADFPIDVHEMPKGYSPRMDDEDEYDDAYWENLRDSDKMATFHWASMIWRPNPKSAESDRYLYIFAVDGDKAELKVSARVGWEKASGFDSYKPIYDIIESNPDCIDEDDQIRITIPFEDNENKGIYACLSKFMLNSSVVNASPEKESRLDFYLKNPDLIAERCTKICLQNAKHVRVYKNKKYTHSDDPHLKIFLREPISRADSLAMDFYRANANFIKSLGVPPRVQLAKYAINIYNGLKEEEDDNSVLDRFKIDDAKSEAENKEPEERRQEFEKQGVDFANYRNLGEYQQALMDYYYFDLTKAAAIASRHESSDLSSKATRELIINKLEDKNSFLYKRRAELKKLGTTIAKISKEIGQQVAENCENHLIDQLGEWLPMYLTKNGKQPVIATLAEVSTTFFRNEYEFTFIDDVIEVNDTGYGRSVGLADMPKGQVMANKIEMMNNAGDFASKLGRILLVVETVDLFLGMDELFKDASDEEKAVIWGSTILNLLSITGEWTKYMIQKRHYPDPIYFKDFDDAIKRFEPDEIAKLSKILSIINVGKSAFDVVKEGMAADKAAKDGLYIDWASHMCLFVASSAEITLFIMFGTAVPLAGTLLVIGIVLAGVILSLFKETPVEAWLMSTPWGAGYKHKYFDGYKTDLEIIESFERLLAGPKVLLTQDSVTFSGIENGHVKMTLANSMEKTIVDCSLKYANETIISSNKKLPIELDAPGQHRKIIVEYSIDFHGDGKLLIPVKGKTKYEFKSQKVMSDPKDPVIYYMVATGISNPT